MYCNKCQKSWTSKDVFCPDCGTKLTGQNSMATPTTESVPVATPPVAPIPTAPIKHPDKKPGKKGSGLTFILLGVIALLLVAIGVILYFAFFNNSSDKPDAEIVPTDIVTEAETEYETVVSEPEIPVIEPATELIRPQVNLIDTMTTDEKKALNIFLSNFSEAYYHSPHSQGSENYELISFAFTHNLINTNGKIFYSGEFMGISAENANATLEKYMGKSVPLSDIAGPSEYEYWFYDGTNFLTYAADGATYANFSIATDMHDNYDGTYTVSFNVYFDEENMFDSIPASRYTSTPSQAAASCMYEYSGTAVVTKKIYNGKNTYELVSYTTR